MKYKALLLHSGIGNQLPDSGYGYCISPYQPY